MKFGQRLEQESVPEWSIHNVDYNSLKYEIKTHTTRDQARAMAIPGQKDMALQRFEDSFFEELAMQHDRVNLFVMSKASEISYRLNYLADSIDRLASKCARSPMTLKRQRRLVKYQQELLHCGDDIQALTRFTTAQTEAFRKILKKYKKWTGSSTLGERFREHVLSDPKSFSRRDFSHLRSRYDETRAVLRTSIPDVVSEPTSPESTLEPDRPRSMAGATTVGPESFKSLPPPQMLYWNEYDHGSDGEGAGTEEPYALYINPEEDVGIPGLHYVQAAFTVPFEKAKAWFGGKKHAPETRANTTEEDLERQALLPERASATVGSPEATGAAQTATPTQPPRTGYSTISSSNRTTSESDADDDLTSNEDNTFPTEGYLVHYATLPSINEQSLARYRENVMFWGTVGCFATSFVVMAIAGVLLFTGRHRNKLEVNAGAALGVITSMFAACAALGMHLCRRDVLTLWHHAVVWTSGLALFVLNGLLLVVVMEGF